MDKTVYRLEMYVVNTRNCILHSFYPIVHAIRFNLYMQYAGYVNVDLKPNNCFEISHVSLIPQKKGGAWGSRSKDAPYIFLFFIPRPLIA